MARWPPSPLGSLKFNVDGSFFSAEGLGCGGIIRDHLGNCHGGFFFINQEGDSLCAEIQAPVIGVEFAWDKGRHDIILETDATKVFHLINHGSSIQHRYYLLIQRANELITSE